MSGERIDWNEIHERIAKTSVAIEKGFSPSPEDRQRILKARADALAREYEREKDAEHVEIVEFMLANEHYGIESYYVSEVYPLKDYTPIPGVPPFVLGLLNVRGRIISVIDIKKFFDMPEKGISDLNSVLIIRDDKMEFGILADSILGVRKIAVERIQPSLPTLTGIRGEFLMGVTGERLAVLDARKLLADKNIIIHEEAWS
ncbi:MAG: chemotaxis protein CheW [Syntrophobacteraceae bacterium]|jgi:purine-binding chemotaxis protein CheW